jgi:hypothetical protein
VNADGVVLTAPAAKLDQKAHRSGIARHNDLILDPFMVSRTTILAAEPFCDPQSP